MTPSSPVAYPVGEVTTSDNVISVDEALNNPNRITRTLAALADQKFYMGNVFSPGQPVEGGATIFERPPTVATDLFANRDVKEVAPGDEFPILDFVRGVPMVARPKKLGGKFFLTKEAVKRNDTRLLKRYTQASANTLNRKVELMGIAELAAVITAETRYGNGSSWADYAALSALNRTGTASPVWDIATAKAAAEAEERGVEYDSILLHTTEWVALISIYGDSAGAKDALASVGITNVYVTHRYTTGRALLFEAGAVGQLAFEFPLEEETEYEGPASGGRQRTWYQFSISPMMFVDNPYAMYEMRGLAA